MDKTVANARALRILKSVNGPYSVEVKKFVDFLETTGLGLRDGIGRYLTELKNCKKIDKEGRFVSYSLSWWNQNLKAVKWSIRYLHRMPTLAELRTREAKATPRLSLMILFLEATSCRISEMLNAEEGRARRGPRITYITITGKGGERPRSASSHAAAPGRCRRSGPRARGYTHRLRPPR